MLQQMQRHQGVRSQRRGRRCRRRSGAVDNTLTAITQTHQTKRTKHALNARHRVAASNAGIMRASPRLTPHVLYTARAPTVWMGRTCKRSQGWRSMLPVRMQTRSGLMVVVCPPVIALLQTHPVAAPAGRAFTSTTLTFHHSESVSVTAAHHFIWKHLYASMQAAQTPASKLRFVTSDKESSMNTLWQEEKFE